MKEELYRQRYETVDATQHLKPLVNPHSEYKSKLKELYVRILRFQARSISELSRNWVVGPSRAIFKLDDWDTLLEEIKLQEARCSRHEEIIGIMKHDEELHTRSEEHVQRTLMLLSKLEGFKVEVKEIRDEIRGRYYTEAQSLCFETLRTSDYQGAKDHNPIRLVKTCDWIFQHPKYLEWISVSSSSQLLWVSADPGCGKSVLARAVIDECKSQDVCYYFFKDESQETRSATYAVCALLHQICSAQPDMIKHVLPAYRINGSKLVTLFGDLWAILLAIINDTSSRGVIFVIDAPDECSDNKPFLKRLAALATKSSKVKILVTSRPYISIETTLFDGTGLNKAQCHLAGDDEDEKALIQKDIDVFIESRIRHFQDLRKLSGTRDDAHEILKAHLSKIENSTYLWVAAIFSKLDKVAGAPRWKLTEIIHTIPWDVQSAYQSILDQSEEQDDLTLVLQITLAAVRPLSLMELNAAISVFKDTSNYDESCLLGQDAFRKWVRDLCGFFINVIDTYVFLVHQTAREFLVKTRRPQSSKGEKQSQEFTSSRRKSSERTGKRDWHGSFDSVDSHTTLAQICMGYLSTFEGNAVIAKIQYHARLLEEELVFDSEYFRRFETMARFQENHHLFLYAAQSWTTHLEQSHISPDLMIVARKLVRSQTGAWRPWFIFTHQDQELRLMSTAITQFTRYFTLLGEDLSVFSQLGCHRCLQKLMSRTDFVMYDKEQLGFALQSAAEAGIYSTVHSLLKSGVSPDVELPESQETSLSLCIKNGHLDVAKVLLEAGANPNRQLLWMSTPHRSSQILMKDLRVLGRMKSLLQISFSNARGSSAMINLLLHHGASIIERDELEQTALHKAAVLGFMDTVKLVLDIGHRDHTIESLDGISPRAAGKQPVRYEGVNNQDQRGRTALYLAVDSSKLDSMLSVEIIQVLIESGSNPHIPDKSGSTPLHRAARRCKPNTARALIKGGADIAAREDRSNNFGIALDVSEIVDTGEKIQFRTVDDHRAVNYTLKQEWNTSLRRKMHIRKILSKESSGLTALEIAEAQMDSIQTSLANRNRELISLLQNEEMDLYGST